ncbi:UDP-2,3-diacylglucosamine diphosphatase [Magnetovirga frankeli]|uniref:UDP-2,3-diacylglucosamine diphosphatase n=1 Tax=Magnetovirga frankeli TaxID=947516 RepID=UPI0012935ABE|nr:UDP-2,3-diacylglucosamine diphosphatase [gamma proteobacterium SS-5]
MAPSYRRALFVSDIHIGTRDAQVDYLLELLGQTRCDYLYLLGDIIDIWKMRSGWHWTGSTNALIERVCQMAAEGTQVYYIPGNHDEMLRDYVGGSFYGVQICHEAIHETADGRRLLLIHGDEFDSVVINNRWLAHLGSWGYDLLLWLNRHFNQLRRRLGFPYWSLSAFIKGQVKNAVNFIHGYEQALIREARQRGFDGIVSGHIHKACLRQIDGIQYANAGDWVESCTALAEDAQGQLSIINWTDELRQRRSQPQSAANSVAEAHLAGTHLADVKKAA